MAICYGLQHTIDRVTAVIAVVAVVAVITVAPTDKQVAVSCEILYWVSCVHESFGAEQKTIALVRPLATELMCGNTWCALFSRYTIYSAGFTYPNVSLRGRHTCEPHARYNV
ncbi:hypothetical protein PG993_001278 [Apiospora rasikravindrae]|uniref:Secreted protein n=1 Tax=Apiospora rasikravindrae TaxID=990691 RepID=A0ABR1UAX3_9PEZI